MSQGKTEPEAEPESKCDDCEVESVDCDCCDHCRGCCDLDECPCCGSAEYEHDI